jgi:hypothetical protein
MKYTVEDHRREIRRRLWAETGDTNGSSQFESVAHSRTGRDKANMWPHTSAVLA